MIWLLTPKIHCNALVGGLMTRGHLNFYFMSSEWHIHSRNTQFWKIIFFHTSSHRILFSLWLPKFYHTQFLLLIFSIDSSPLLLLPPAMCCSDAEYEYFEQRQLPARPVQPGLQPLLQVSADLWCQWWCWLYRQWLICWLQLDLWVRGSKSALHWWVGRPF